MVQQQVKMIADVLFVCLYVCQEYHRLERDDGVIPCLTSPMSDVIPNENLLRFNT
jgi:hypothetical protein